MTSSASQRITEVVTSWPGVTAGPGGRGEWSFNVHDVIELMRLNYDRLVARTTVAEHAA